jgi:hypothetical protein
MIGASGGCVVNNVLVDLVGKAQCVILFTEIGDELQLLKVKTLPVGLFGLQIIIAFVFSLKAERSSSRSNSKPASVRRSGTCTGVASERIASGA